MPVVPESSLSDVAVVTRALEELRATGASPRDVIRAGVDELTASELRVARMAAEGMSNKQIAQALLITVKTVETHLHRSYQKLGVGSRSELGHVLDSAPRRPYARIGLGGPGPNVGGLMDAKAEGSAQTAANYNRNAAIGRRGANERQPMHTTALKPQVQDPARHADSPESGGQTPLTRSEPAAPPWISLRFDSATGPLTGVLIDERTGQARWFMGWHELIRELQATRPQAQDDPSLRAAATAIAFGLVRTGRLSPSDQARER